MENGLRWKITNDRRTNENEKNFMADYIFYFAYSGVYQDCILDGEEFLIGEGEKMSRYIDADLIEECKEIADDSFEWGTYVVKMSAIRELPTAEVRPDIPGEWIPVVDDEGFVTKHKCSKCNAIGFRSMNFCPECGSRNFRMKEKMRVNICGVQQKVIKKVKEIQDFCESQTCDACVFRENLKEGEKWCGLNYPKTYVTPEAKIYKEAAESFYSGLIEGLKGTDRRE